MSEPLVIFDCDGVLVDSERIANGVLAALISEAGLPTTTAECMRTYMGRSMKSCIEAIEERLGISLRSDFHDEYQRRVFEHFHRDLTAVPGVAEALREIPTARCVASSSGIDRIELALRLTGLLDHFVGRIFSATEVAHGKPAPDIFLHAASRMSTEPRHCIVVEDTVVGARAGVAAGMTVLGFARDTDAERLRGEGAVVFHEMAELPALLRDLGSV